MRYIRFIFALLLLVLPASRVSAQWSGSVDATGGFGVMKSLRGQFWEEMPQSIYHSLGQGTVRVNYKTPTFVWTSLLEGKVEAKSTDNYHLTVFLIDGRNDEDALDMNAIVKMNEEHPVSGQYRTEFSWRPAPGRRYTAWAQYKLNFKESSNLTYKANWKSTRESLAEESPVTWEHTGAAGFRTYHELGGPRLLAGDFFFNVNDKRQENMWSTMGVQPVEGEEEEVWMGCYKLTPHSRVTSFSGSVSYRDSLLTGAVRLMVSPGIRFHDTLSIHQNSGATLDFDQSTTENLVWRDSTQIREWFRFASQDYQPYLEADFLWRSLHIHADYALMLYARKLTDSTHYERYKWQKPNVVGNGRIDWRFSPHHQLSLTNSRTVHHPTYLQVCWFDRSGGYMEQLYRGSEQLRATRSQVFRLAYDFTYKRFVASTAFSYTRKEDEIEQTWFKEEIDSRTYKVFTWLNGADSRILGAQIRTGWRGKIITANTGVEYNYTIRTWRNDEKVKRSNDWRVTADVAARLPKGWTLSADMRYRSSVSTFFAVFKSYCVLNARVQKDFKRFAIHLQGRDLLDKPMESEFVSEDQTECWTESTLHNRRLILLGFSWKF